MRILNEKELEIVEKKERRLGRKLPVTGIEYRKAIPRTTVCILKGEKGIEIGVSVRSKWEEDIPAIGEVVSFTRALDTI